MVGRQNLTQTVAPGAAIAERRDPEVGSNTATILSKKSGAVQVHAHFSFLCQ